MGVALTEQEWDAILVAIYAGRKIEAIKLYREASGEGLVNAKSEIERITERLREEHPDRFSATPGGGCLAVLLLGAGILAGGVGCGEVVRRAFWA